jgi:hypothetical protein
MYCHQCQTQLPDIARFCISCGAGVADTRATSNLEYSNKSEQKKRGVSPLTVVSAIVLTCLLLGGYFSHLPNGDNRSQSSNPSAFQVPLPIPQTHETQLVNDELALPPGYIKHYSFVVKGQGAISGRFEARGGIDDAIQVIVTDRDGLTNLRNGNRFRRWYNSGEKTVEDISMSLSAGEYVLVFSNRGSLTNRTTKTNVKLDDYY